MSLGLTDYSLGDKTEALADFRQTLKLNPSVRQRFEPPTTAPPGGGRGGQRMRAVLDDKEFLKQLFPEK